MIEDLTADPAALLVVGVVVLALVGMRVWRWRRESAMRSHAEDRGWWRVDDAEPFARAVVDRFPELREDAERDARAARGRADRGRGPGTTVSVGPGGRTGSAIDARNVHVVPTDVGDTLPAEDGGGIAVGDVTVTGRAGRVSSGRSSVHRGAAVARLDTVLPDLKLLGRDWIDRDQGGDLPDPVVRRFNDVSLGGDARTRYLDTDALAAVADSEVALDGVAVEGDTAVFLCRHRLTPDRAAALAGVATSFLGAAIGSDDGSGEGAASLRDPLGPG